MSGTSKPIAVYTIPTVLLWTCRIGGGVLILFGIVCSAALVLQGSALYSLAVLPLVSLGWVYGRFTTRPDLEFFADHLNYKATFFRRCLRYSDIEGLALAQRGQGRRRVTVLFAKDHRHRAYALFVPGVFVRGGEIVAQLERLTGRTTVKTKSSAEFRQWTKETMAQPGAALRSSSPEHDLRRPRCRIVCFDP
jgi:hypothetical protein